MVDIARGVSESPAPERSLGAPSAGPGSDDPSARRREPPVTSSGADRERRSLLERATAVRPGGEGVMMTADSMGGLLIHQHRSRGSSRRSF